jgi:hypothetical protein
MSSTAESSRPDRAAWKRFCARMGDIGEALFDDPYPGDPRSQADGLAHLTDQIVCWLAWTTEHGDPASPRFHRHNDLVTQWGGPNYDNVYRHARIDPALRYRISGSMGCCEDFLLALRSGFMHTDTWGTLAEITASERGVGRGDEFEILLGGQDGVPIPDGAVMASVREYYFDWTAEAPASFSIECLDAAPVAVPRSPAVLGRQIDEAAALIEGSVEFWNRYLNDARSQRRPNSFEDPVNVAKGLSIARYSFCFWELDADEALVIETDVPDARYYSFQLYPLGWFEPIDPEQHVSARNQTQLQTSDERVQVVVSGQDPGSANWLDTAGHRSGLCTLRWFWPRDGAPEPSPSTVVRPVGSLRADAVISQAERAKELASRRRHLARRFAT